MAERPNWIGTMGWSSYSRVPLSSVQKGAIGQFVFLATALVTGNGKVEAYTPSADNEGRDAEIRRHLSAMSAIGIQVKITLALRRNGLDKKTFLILRVHLPANRIQNDPRLWYFLAVYDPKELRFLDPVFLVPAHVMNAMARKAHRKGYTDFEVIANLSADSRDQWSPYRVALRDLGRRLLEIIDEAPLTAQPGCKPLPKNAVVIGRRPRRHRQDARRRRAA